jgi:hypothetical protein
MVLIVVDQSFQDETTSKVLRIMMFSQRMSDCRQSDTKRFAPIQFNGAANAFAAQLVRPEIRQHFASYFSAIQTTSGLSSGQTGLPSEESKYPLRS